VGQPAHALLQSLGEADLADLIWKYGEERASRRLARAITKAQTVEPILTTDQLRRVITQVLPKGVKPEGTLSRVFQALRIAVNDELGALRDILGLIPQCLAPAARVVFISYHSLEDRLVKQWLDTESRDCICPPQIPACRCGHVRSLRLLTRKAVRPSSKEEQENIRSRSARLRAAEIL
jgi:16S rRNA (cytosine1402-N4)-methyltransferase